MLIEKKASALAGVLAMIGGIAAVVVARGFPPSLTSTDIGPSVFPTAYGILLAVAGLALLFVSLRPGKSAHPVEEAAAQEAEVQAHPSLLKLVLGVLMAGVYMVAISYAGFAVSTVVYIGLMIGTMRGASALLRPWTGCWRWPSAWRCTAFSSRCCRFRCQPANGWKAWIDVAR